MLKYIFGTYSITGGSYDGKTHKITYYHTPPSFYWYLKIPLVRTGWCGSKGAYFRYNNRFFEFFWKPYSDGYFDKDGVWYKSKKFQFITFEISPNKGKNMNVTPNTNTVDAPDNLVVGETVSNFYYDSEGNRIEIPFDIDGPNDGKTYSGSEASSEETTVYIVEDAADHPATIH